ncbi:hypothetical protein NMY22_g12344 [Coprinellus aureogranulatus]|nr:hypothetical protein NMY22_g12344 [Coprinellus aureogranulatus]
MNTRMSPLSQQVYGYGLSWAAVIFLLASPGPRCRQSAAVPSILTARCCACISLVLEQGEAERCEANANGSPLLEANTMQKGKKVMIELRLWVLKGFFLCLRIVLGVTRRKVGGFATPSTVGPD